MCSNQWEGSHFVFIETAGNPWSRFNKLTFLFLSAIRTLIFSLAHQLDASYIESTQCFLTHVGEEILLVSWRFWFLTKARKEETEAWYAGCEKNLCPVVLTSVFSCRTKGNLEACNALFVLTIHMIGCGRV